MTRAADMLAVYAALLAAVFLFCCVLVYFGCRRIRRSMTRRLVEFNEAAARLQAARDSTASDGETR